MEKLRLCVLAVVLGLFILGLTSSNAGAVYLEEEPKDEAVSGAQSPEDFSQYLPPKPEYVPGEIIVKFKTSQAVEEMDQAIAELESTTAPLSQALSETSSLAGLEARVGVAIQKAVPVFKALKAGSRIDQGAGEGLSQGTASSTEEVRSYDLFYIYKLTMDTSTDIPKACAELAKDTGVEYAEPNYIYKAQRVPNDPYYHSSGTWGQDYDDLWGLKKIQCETAWDITIGSPDVIVAVVDTGADYDHEDLAANIWINQDEIPDNGIDDDENGYIDDVRGWDFHNNDNDPKDGHGHGTHVSGTIAAITDNGIGVAGISWHSKIMPLKGLSDSGSGYSDRLAQAIAYAADSGARMINCSWGAPVSDLTIEAAVDYAYDLGCVIVAAAGNDNVNVSFFSPANCENVISVAALDNNDQKAYFSNGGTEVDVAAPGVDILSLRAAGTDMYGDGSHTVGENYLRASGTSMAAPQVSGLAALIISVHPEFTHEEVETYIKGTADDISAMNPDYVGLLGSGRINAYKALTSEPVPKLFVKDIQIAEVEADNDGKIDPGETIDLSIVFVNHGLEVIEFFGLLTTEDPHVTILTDSTSFGNIPCGEEGMSVTPLRLKISSDLEANRDRRLDLVFTITAMATPAKVTLGPDGGIATGERDKQEYTFEIPVMVDYPEVSAAPLYIPRIYLATVDESVVIEDLDNDGRKEAVNFVHLNSESDPLSLVVSSLEDMSALPKVVPIPGTENSVISPWGPVPVVFPAREVVVGDVNGDGRKEIFFNIYLVNSDQGVNDRYIFALDPEGNILNSSWPLDLDSEGETPHPGPILADVTGDGTKEIVFATRDTGGNIGPETRCRLYVVDDQGVPLTGWPVLVSQNEPLLIERLAAGDINGDGLDEIVASVQLGPAWNTGGYVYAWDAEGNLCSGWPKELPRDTQSLGVALGDIDRDYPGLEVVGMSRLSAITPTTVEKDIRSSLHVWHYDGTPVSGWEEPKYTLGPLEQWPRYMAPVVCDLDQDGSLEIIMWSPSLIRPGSNIYSGSNIYAFRSDGSGYRNEDGIFARLEAGTFLGKELIIANIDDGPNPEVIVGTYSPMTRNRALMAYNYDGSANKAFPISFGNQCFLSLPTVDDVDGDGKAEICINELRPGNREPIDESYLKTHIFDSSAEPLVLDWPTYRHDPQNTGCYSESVTQTIDLSRGWNYFSLGLTPQGSHDMLDVLAPILDHVVRVRDEEGNSIINRRGQWINYIGDWKATEGYKIYVDQDVTLEVAGREISKPFSVPLRADWNMISYPYLNKSRDALEVLRPLIDAGYLIKVEDEAGRSVEMDEEGEWSNAIGDMRPGEGYHVRVNTACALEYTNPTIDQTEGNWVFELPTSQVAPVEATGTTAEAASSPAESAPEESSPEESSLGLRTLSF